MSLSFRGVLEMSFAQRFFACRNQHGLKPGGDDDYSIESAEIIAPSTTPKAAERLSGLLVYLLHDNINRFSDLNFSESGYSNEESGRE